MYLYYLPRTYLFQIGWCIYAGKHNMDCLLAEKWFGCITKEYNNRHPFWCMHNIFSCAEHKRDFCSIIVEWTEQWWQRIIMCAYSRGWNCDTWNGQHNFETRLQVNDISLQSDDLDPSPARDFFISKNLSTYLFPSYLAHIAIWNLTGKCYRNICHHLYNCTGNSIT